MSLHAQLSPEAQARLQAQRRNSTISSVIISILVLVLICLILAFIFLDPFLKETPVIVSYQGTVAQDEQLEVKKMNNSVERKPSAPSSSMAKVIAATTMSPTAVPVPEIDVPDPSTDFGNGDDFGDGWGSGGDGGGGGGFGNIPATMRKRCSPEDRIARLTENGGTPQCEETVVKGLRWLKSTQNADGSWTGNNQCAMTGLALLAYLGHCETPLSEEFGDSCLKAITYLVDRGMKNNGLLSSTAENNPKPYEHGIATYALGEAATFCKQLNITVPNLMEVTRKAGQLIIDNQHKSGGWDYGYSVDSDRGGDLSVAAWQIQALKACKHTGIEFKGLNRCARKALDYVEARSQSSGAFAYDKNGDSHLPNKYYSLTGAGMLCLQMWDKASAPKVRGGAKYIEENSKFNYGTKDADLYGHYYESQAMINRGADQWKNYNKMFRDQVLNNQNPDGSWKAPNNGGGLNATGAQYQNNVHYRTCLCILMLEVYYRFLPATGGGH
ncbi:prenyltransferase/squalene oxidase repeat-containing protein [Luteolibacter marinus]|uniref:prenyltransferase/squalene oxidase repeat-containing protein n=1 Tax=Luteolibacter marinus TaxID=2776705 RepID=UPI001866DF21|nr:prenyltransferase/squalene oxidase repeat-containing protein [Luteolibacter marinus]